MRYNCIKCNDDFLEHQTIIADQKQRCLCLNCWGVIRTMKEWRNKR